VVDFTDMLLITSFIKINQVKVVGVGCAGEPVGITSLTLYMIQVM